MHKHNPLVQDVMERAKRLKFVLHVVQKAMYHAPFAVIADRELQDAVLVPDPVKYLKRLMTDVLHVMETDILHKYKIDHVINAVEGNDQPPIGMETLYI